MTEDVIKALNKSGDQGKFHVAMLEHGKNLVKLSRSKMSNYYSDWDLFDQVYRGERDPDQDDKKQEKKGNPIKMVVPNTFAQVMTFTSFLFLMFKQNRTFFELTPTGNEDYGTKQQDCETIMERDLQHNSWDRVLYQHLLDVGRFGPGITECCWTRKVVRAWVAGEATSANYMGVAVGGEPESSWKEYTKYEGNLIRAVSPYRFFPDTRYPLCDFQKGEFCAAEEEYSKGALRDLEKVGEVAGIEKIEGLPIDWIKSRGGETRTNMDYGRGDNIVQFLTGPSQSEGTVLVTKMQVWIVPSKFEVEPGKKLGPEEFRVLYHLWYANDNRVIRCEPAYYWHNEFGWTLSQFTPDMHQTVNFSLADLIYRLQDVITWHINSRITDVRRNMRGRLIVDPTGIETSSLDGDGDIYMRSTYAKAGIDRFVKQLQFQDVTQGHMTDAELLGKLMQVVTGVNDNLMGQYNSGRRSAQEARTVLGGAAGRMKLHGHLIWNDGFAPLGRQMLSNSRQSLPEDQFLRIVGTPAPDDPEALQDMVGRFAAFRGTPEEVICGDDYFTFDSTLASEKGFMAQSLQDLLVAILSSDPVAAARMTQGIDPVKLVEEIQYLRGGGNIKRFKYTPQEQAEVQQQQAAALEAQKPAPTSNIGDTHAPQVHLDQSRQVTIKMPNKTSNGAKKK